MTTQLKRNAQYFAESLEKDKGLVLSASEVLDKNYDAMTKERIRLKDHSGKSRGTTWLVIGLVVGVTMACLWMFLLIRIT
jgi:SNARE protein 1